MKTKLYQSALVLMALSLLSSCNSAHKAKEYVKKAKTEIGSLQKVWNQVAKKVDDGYVNVNITNGRFLTVTITNSKMNDWDAKDRKGKARIIARAAYDSYDSRAQLEKVFVSFSASKTYLSFFHATHTIDSYDFKAADLKAHSKTARGRPAAS